MTEKKAKQVHEIMCEIEEIKKFTDKIKSLDELRQVAIYGDINDRVITNDLAFVSEPELVKSVVKMIIDGSEQRIKELKDKLEAL